MSIALNEYIEHHDWEVEDFEKVVKEVGALRAANKPMSMDMLKNQIQDLRICESSELKKTDVLSMCLNPHFQKRAEIGFQKISNRNKPRQRRHHDDDKW